MGDPCPQHLPCVVGGKDLAHVHRIEEMDMRAWEAGGMGARKFLYRDVRDSLAGNRSARTPAEIDRPIGEA